MKRKRPIKKGPTASSSRISKQPFASASQRPSAAPAILKSAWKSKNLLTRPGVKTVPCQFIRTSATYDSKNAQVELQVGNLEETIEIAAEWEFKDQSGYIGAGFTKRGIYVRFILFKSLLV